MFFPTRPFYRSAKFLDALRRLESLLRDSLDFSFSAVFSLPQTSPIVVLLSLCANVGSFFIFLRFLGFRKSLKGLSQSQLFSMCTIPPMFAYMQTMDRAFYQVVADILIPAVLQPNMSSSLNLLFLKLFD